jgi:hypothetical protein
MQQSDSSAGSSFDSAFPRTRESDLFRTVSLDTRWSPRLDRGRV